MPIRLLRAAGRAAAPWKNGGGVTHEIAVWPPGADLASFDWRVSMATVAEGGPFSVFPGIDRSLSVLEGELVLALAGRDGVRLTPASPPLAFPGDVPAQAETPVSPVRDLNVMTRRGVVVAEVTRLRAPFGRGAMVGVSTLIVSRFHALWLNGSHRLGLDDAALIEEEPFQLQGDDGAEAFIINFDRLSH